MISNEQLSPALLEFMPHQRWFGAKDRRLTEVVIERVTILKQDLPALLGVEVEAVLDDNSSDRYHILVGLRVPGDPAVFLEGKAEAVLGEFDSEAGAVYAYDALRDPHLSLEVFRNVAPKIDVPKLVRTVGAEQSNTSLIYDDEFILKVFRRLTEGPNLDVEITGALWSTGFQRVAEPLGVWRSGGNDLALLQRYLAGGVEGWALATTSLRDHYNSGGDPGAAGGDFAAEAERLGEVTAEMHIALGRALNLQKGDPAEWVSLMVEQLDSVDHPSLDKDAAAKVFQRASEVEEAGPAIRAHGDFHLGQVMRTDLGWYILDFEGEPARSIEERRRPTSPLKDVAGMLRSLHYAASAARLERDDDPHELAQSWEDRNRQAFMEGYVAIAHRGEVLPTDLASLDLLLAAFELDKAIYELGYELAHRPGWVDIPAEAITRLLARL